MLAPYVTAKQELMEAKKSRYWNTYRASKTYRLTLHIYEAHLIGSKDSVGSPRSFEYDTYCAVLMLRSASQTRHKTSLARKTANPVWNNSIVFNDVGFAEKLRIEVKAKRKLGDKPVLGYIEFKVHEVMGLSVQGHTSTFQLNCVGSRIEGGVLLIAVEFDPPVERDNVEEVLPDGAVPSPTYINVRGDFASLALDTDGAVSWEPKDVTSRVCKQCNRPVAEQNKEQRLTSPTKAKNKCVCQEARTTDAG
ncbi:unnamed protein product [Chrysoparadoxa australica]